MKTIMILATVVVLFGCQSRTEKPLAPQVIDKTTRFNKGMLTQEATPHPVYSNWLHVTEVHYYDTYVRD